MLRPTTPSSCEGARPPVFDTLTDRLVRRPSGPCAARAGSPTPTSTPLPARSASRCSRPTSTSPSSRTFIDRVKERARGAEVHQALNPAQQFIKIVNDELIAVIGGETRRLRFAKTPPTVILLAGLQGSGQDHARRQARRSGSSPRGTQPLLVAADLQRPNAVTQLQVVGEQAGVAVFAPEPGNGVGDPVAGRPALDDVRPREACSTSSSSTPPAGSASTPSSCSRPRTSATRSIRTRSCSSSTR